VAPSASFAAGQSPRLRERRTLKRPKSVERDRKACASGVLAENAHPFEKRVRLPHLVVES
jgi:hypothetical protein